MNNINTIKGLVTAIAAFLSALLGTLYIPVLLMVLCNIIDYITGCMAASNRPDGGICSYRSIRGIKKKVKPYLEKACADSGVNMIFFMLTNILTESSELLCGGPEAKEKILNAYDLPEDTDTIMLKGVVSRKKQLVPTLVSVLQQ